MKCTIQEGKMREGFIPPHGGYRNLLSYRKAEIVYDATVWFCDRYIDRRSRTHDQMVQAARSGKQNIIEGSMASGTSKEMEIKLTNVARASLEELLADYQDFLRTRGLRLWAKDSREAVFVRGLGRQGKKTGTVKTRGTSGMQDHSSYESHRSHESYETYRPFIETRPPEVVANIIICLIHQTTYLLRRQLTELEQGFLKEGGLRERMTRARLKERAMAGRRC
jgi:four helix bundle suffix protein